MTLAAAPQQERPHEHLGLCVDDDKDYRERLSRLGRAFNAEMLAVSSKTEAEEVLRTRKPCTLFVDRGILDRPGDAAVEPNAPLPDELARLGHLVVAYARGREWALPKGEFPYVVVMTGQSDREHYGLLNDVYQLGANYFVPKPIWKPRRPQEDPQALLAEGFTRCRKNYPLGCPGVARNDDNARPRLLQLVGEKRGRGHLIRIDGRELTPTAPSFRILHRAHLGREAGLAWIHPKKLYLEGDNHSQAMKRLREQLGAAAAILEPQPPEQGRETGRVRLAVSQVEVVRASIEAEPALRGLLDELPPLDE